MPNKTSQDNNYRIKTEVGAVWKLFLKLQTELRISVYPLVFVKCVYILKKTQKLSNVEAMDGPKSQQQQHELNC